MNTYKYKGKEYPSRKKSFKDYRIKAIMFLKEYDAFESLHFPSIAKTQSEIQTQLLSDTKVTNKLMNNQSSESKLNKAVTEAITSNPELVIKTKQLNEDKTLCKDLFLFSDGKGKPNDEKVKMLCEIMLEDSKDINHDADALEYDEYLEFIYTLWDDFFLKKK